MLVVFGVEEFLSLLAWNIQSNPALVLGVNYGVFLNSGGDEPIADSLNGFFRRSEHVIDLLWCPMFAIVGRIWVRTSESSAAGLSSRLGRARKPHEFVGALTHP